jgi:polar amino acid transport system substrate-binding protein
VLTSSIAAMKLNQAGVETLPGLFEDELLDMLAKRELAAAAITRTSAEYYNARHPSAKLQLVDLFAGQPDLSWNVAVGLRRPDEALRKAVDAAMAKLIADGTVQRVYGHYGIAVQPAQ